MCAHRCLRPVALRAVAATSWAQRPHQSADAPAVAEPGEPQPEPWEEGPKERARREKAGREGGGGEERPITSSRISPRALLLGTFDVLVRASLPPSSPLWALVSPSPHSLLHPHLSPLPPNRVSPPLLFASLPSSGSSSSRFSGPGDGQRARAALQLRIHRPPRRQLLAPPPPFQPPLRPPAPVPRLGQRRGRRRALPAACAAQPSRAPGWRFPLRTGE